RRATAGDRHAIAPGRDREAGAAGGVGGFVGPGQPTMGRLYQAPGATAVFGGVDLEVAVDRVAEQPAALAVEGHAVEKRALVAVPERQGPARTAIVGAVHPRVRAGPDRQHHGGDGVEAFDVAEIE